MTDPAPDPKPPRTWAALTLASWYFGLLALIYLSVLAVAIARGLLHPINDFQRFVSWMAFVVLSLLAAGAGGAAYGLHKRRIWGGVLGMLFAALTFVPALLRRNLIGLGVAVVSAAIGIIIGRHWHELGGGDDGRGS